MRRTLVVLGALSALAGQRAAQGAHLWADETDRLRLVYYSPSHRYLIPHLIRSFENALNFHSSLFGYHSKGRLTLLFEDFTDSGYGSATAVPRNFVEVGIEPPNLIYETTVANDRINFLMSHELLHVVAADRPGGWDPFFRRLFGGKVAANAEDPVSMAYTYLTNPRANSPRWYHEGLAVFMETWMSGGLGRTLGGYDEMVFRAMVRDGTYIYRVVGLESEGTTIDFQVGANSYLYGTRFVTYLADRHGVDKLVQWAKRDDGSRRYFSSQFRAVYQSSLNEEWSRWIEAERTWQSDNLARIRQHPVTPLRRLTGVALGSVSRAYWDAERGELYAAVQYPGHMAHLAAIDVKSGRIRRLGDVEGASLYFVCSLAYDRSGRRLFYSNHNKGWRDLYVLDLKTGRRRELLHEARTGDLAFSVPDGALWGVRHSDGFSSLVRIAPPYRDWTEVWRCEYGHDLFDLDVSPDGRYLTAAEADVSGRQRLVRLETAALLAGNATAEVLYDFEFNSPANFVYSPDGRYLYGSSYYTGVSNVFRYDFERQQMEVLSNAETGLFRPVPQPDGSLLAFEYTARGFVPVSLPVKPVEDVSAIRYLGQQVVEHQPVVKSWKLGSPAEVDLARVRTYSGDYRPARQMSLVSAYPIVQGYKDQAAVGWRINLADDIFFSNLDATLSFTPGGARKANERAHASVEYRYWDWKISAYYNHADFYDLFGPTKNSRKGYSARLDHHTILRYELPRTMSLDWSVAGYGGLDSLPDYQNVAAPFSRFLMGQVALKYAYLEKSLGGVDDEKGVQWQIAFRNNYVNRTMLPRVYATYDYGFLLPIRNSGIWVRSAAGYSFGDRNQPFANFYFGGFGNNWVDRLSTSRYREYYSFPGVELNQVGTKDFARTLVEWNLPPMRFKSLGMPWLYCNWARLSLFSAGLLTGLGRPATRTLFGDAGAQLDFRIVPLSYLNSTFSVGYARAAGTRGEHSGEFMVSLKLL